MPGTCDRKTDGAVLSAVTGAGQMMIKHCASRRNGFLLCTSFSHSSVRPYGRVLSSCLTGFSQVQLCS
jgi:hypothetical protein